MYSYIVIDDEAIIRKGLIKKINDIPDSPYLCAGEAENGKKGLELVDALNPDIIITDMKMNKMDGVEFLESLRNNRLDQPVIVISSFKDFEYMHKAIESRVIGYVLKPFSSEEIEEQLKKAVREIEERSQMRSIEEKIQMVEAEEKNQRLQAAILGNFDQGILTEERLQEHFFARLVSVNHRCRGAYETACMLFQDISKGVKCTVIRNSLLKSQFFILLYTDKERDGYLRLKAEHAAERLLEKYEGGKMVCVISRGTRSIRKLNSLRKDNDKVLGELYAGHYRNLLYSETSENFQMIYSQECIDRWFRRMQHNVREVPAVMESFFGNMDVSQFKLGDIKKTCACMIKKIDNYAEEKNVETDDILRYFDTRYIFDDDLGRMSREISGYISLIFQSVRGQEKEEPDLFEEINRYIRENYNKKITLSMIADSVYTTPSMCRNILKERQISFNEYVTRLRIEHAKQLLEESGSSIESIAREIGYTNPKYFFKVFKKMVGETPQEYRKNRR